jgi:hypothetical protein
MENKVIYVLCGFWSLISELEKENESLKEVCERAKRDNYLFKKGR